MECVNDHALDVLYMAILLAAFALAGLIYTAINARRSVLGGRLLAACADDWRSALLAIDTTRQTTELMTHADPRVRRRWFTRDP
jgi:hypothetical protein